MRNYLSVLAIGSIFLGGCSQKVPALDLGDVYFERPPKPSIEYKPRRHTEEAMYPIYLEAAPNSEDNGIKKEKRPDTKPKKDLIRFRKFLPQDDRKPGDDFA